VEWVSKLTATKPYKYELLVDGTILTVDPEYQEAILELVGFTHETLQGTEPRFVRLTGDGVDVHRSGWVRLEKLRKTIVRRAETVGNKLQPVVYFVQINGHEIELGIHCAQRVLDLLGFPYEAADFPALPMTQQSPSGSSNWWENTASLRQGH